MTQRRPIAFLTPEEIATQDRGVPVAVHFPASDVFAERARRLDEIAAGGHALAGFLKLLARLAAAQQLLLDDAAASEDLVEVAPDPAVDDDADIDADADADADADQAAGWGGPPLDRIDDAVRAGWQTDLRALLAAFTRLAAADGSAALPAATRAVLTRLADADDDWLDNQAVQRLSGLLRSGLDAAAAPFIAAALQVHWTREVLAWHEANPGVALPRVDEGRSCPCCGSLPVASLVRIGSSDSGNRYLVCGLCQAQWHWVRIRCTHCGGTAGIQYFGLSASDGDTGATASDAADDPGRGEEGQPGSAVQIETCDSCQHYLKIVDRSRDHRVEPLADDLGSLSLDLLASEAGWQRHGDNPLLLLGNPDPADAQPPPRRLQ